MIVQTLLEDLRRRGVAFEIDGERLYVDAPAEVTTEKRLVELKEHKQGLLKLLQLERHNLEKASKRGLIVRWSEYPTWIKLHDPTTGEWHEIKASQCLPGLVQMANKYRKKGDA